MRRIESDNLIPLPSDYVTNPLLLFLYSAPNPAHRRLVSGMCVSRVTAGRAHLSGCIRSGSTGGDHKSTGNSDSGSDS